VYYYFADVLGSTRVVTDSSGAVCGVYPERSRGNADYYPYRQEVDYNTACMPSDEFAGRQEFHSRHLSRQTGNFLTRTELLP